MKTNQHTTRTRLPAILASLALLPVSTAASAQEDTKPDRARSGSDMEMQHDTDAETTQATDSAREHDSEASQKPAAEGSRGSPATRGEPSTESQGNANRPGSEAHANRNQAQGSIDPAQVQKVFGRDASMIALDGLNQSEVRNMQARLKELGHYRAEIDGIVGPKTRAALRAAVYQRFMLSQQLVAQGRIPTFLAPSLGVNDGQLSPVSGQGSTESYAPTNRQSQPASPPSDDTSANGKTDDVDDASHESMDDPPNAEPEPGPRY